MARRLRGRRLVPRTNRQPGERWPVRHDLGGVLPLRRRAALDDRPGRVLPWPSEAEPGPGDRGGIPGPRRTRRQRIACPGDNPFGGGAPKLWQTEDGSTWTLVDSPTWREALANDMLISVAAGPAGVVVVGAAGSNCPACDPNPQGSSVIIHSSDGVTWDRLDLSAAFDKAYFSDVTAYPDGFVIVGRVGEADDWTGAGSGTGVPAAWTSPDGVTWVAADVEGTRGRGCDAEHGQSPARTACLPRGARPTPPRRRCWAGSVQRLGVDGRTIVAAARRDGHGSAAGDVLVRGVRACHSSG